jgi:polysaccharide biosynthesis protein PslH
MRILILAQQYPDTLACGYRGRLYRQIQGYHRHGHQVDLMAFVAEPFDAVKRGLVEPYCREVMLFPEQSLPSRSSYRRWHTVFSRLDSGSLTHSSSAFAERLRARLRDQPPDVVQMDGYCMLQYRKQVKDIPCVAFPIDCSTLSVERERHRNPATRLRFALCAAKLRRMESRYNTFFASVFVATPDAQRAKQLSPEANIRCIPNGVDADYFAPTAGPVEPETIAFHGSMSFPPNIVAATWFIAEVWPSLRDRHPGARFLLVGTNPDEQILSAAAGDDRIVVTGFVPDIRPYLQSASVLVVPMQSGGGIKNKVLEGMAMAKPVVLTSLATAGIEHAVPGQHFVVANTPRECVEAICRLWQDPAHAAALGASARELVRSRYTWECMEDACERLMCEAAHSGPRAANA